MGCINRALYGFYRQTKTWKWFSNVVVCWQPKEERKEERRSRDTRVWWAVGWAVEHQRLWINDDLCPFAILTRITYILQAHPPDYLQILPLPPLKTSFQKHQYGSGRSRDVKKVQRLLMPPWPRQGISARERLTDWLLMPYLICQNSSENPAHTFTLSSTGSSYSEKCLCSLNSPIGCGLNPP